MTPTLLALSLPALLVFIYRYVRYSPWSATYQGRTLLAQKIALAALVGHFLVKEFWMYPGWAVVEVAVVGLVGVMFWVTLWGLLKAQRHTRPVPKKQGQGYVMPDEVERTGPRVVRPRRNR